MEREAGMNVEDIIRKIKLLYWEAYEKDHQQSTFEMSNSNAHLFLALIEYFNLTQGDYE